MAPLLNGSGALMSPRKLDLRRLIGEQIVQVGIGIGGAAQAIGVDAAAAELAAELHVVIAAASTLRLSMNDRL